MENPQQIAERVKAIAAPIVWALGLELVEVACSGQGGRMVLRVFIDKPGGVSLNDCEQVHLSLGTALDVEDPIPHAYTLEVSSPGLDRPFRKREDYCRSVGKQVCVKLRQPHEGQWRVVGQLVEVEEPGVTLALTQSRQNQTVRLDWEAIAEARLEVDFGARHATNVRSR